MSKFARAAAHQRCQCEILGLWLDPLHQLYGSPCALGNDQCIRSPTNTFHLADTPPATSTIQMVLLHPCTGCTTTSSDAPALTGTVPATVGTGLTGSAGTSRSGRVSPCPSGTTSGRQQGQSHSTIVDGKPATHPRVHGFRQYKVGCTSLSAEECASGAAPVTPPSFSDTR